MVELSKARRENAGFLSPYLDRMTNEDLYQLAKLGMS
jgi:hypothetical protein